MCRMWLEYLRTVTIKLNYSCRKIFQSHGASGYYTHSTYGTCIFTKYLSARLVDLHGKSKKIYHTLPKKLAALDEIPKGNFIFQGFCFRGKLLTCKASTRHTFGIGNAEVCRFLTRGHGLMITFLTSLRRTFWRTWKRVEITMIYPQDAWQLFCSVVVHLCRVGWPFLFFGGFRDVQLWVSCFFSPKIHPGCGAKIYWPREIRVAPRQPGSWQAGSLYF